MSMDDSSINQMPIFFIGHSPPEHTVSMKKFFSAQPKFKPVINKFNRLAHTLGTKVQSKKKAVSTK